MFAIDLRCANAVAATGTNNPRSTASGVSKATVTTMAGMVVAIAGMLFASLVNRRLTAESNKLNDLIEIGDPASGQEEVNNASIP